MVGAILLDISERDGYSCLVVLAEKGMWEGGCVIEGYGGALQFNHVGVFVYRHVIV